MPFPGPGLPVTAYNLVDVAAGGPFAAPPWVLPLALYRSVCGGVSRPPWFSHCAGHQIVPFLVAPLAIR